MDRGEVLRRRLSNQAVTGPGLGTAAEVVARLACVQSQEWAHAFWSLGMRTSSRLGYAAVQREFDAGDFLRTHILRPTWHYVCPEDIGWILAATSTRVHARNAGMYRQTDLDQAVRDRAVEVLLDVLRGTALTRAEVGTALAGEGIRADGMRLAYVLMSAELDGHIASGPLRGAQHTYVRLDERLAGRRLRQPADPVAELLLRFLAGHGPATLADFTRWSSVATADAEHALAVIRDRLAVAEVEGATTSSGRAETVWEAADAPESAAISGRAFLVPLYDELTLSYPKINFTPVPGHPHPPGEDLFRGTVIIDERNVGLWKRTVRGRRVQIELDLAAGCSAADRDAAHSAAEDLAHFLGRELVQ